MNPIFEDTATTPVTPNVTLAESIAFAATMIVEGWARGEHVTRDHVLRECRDGGLPAEEIHLERHFEMALNAARFIAFTTNLKIPARAERGTP